MNPVDATSGNVDWAKNLELPNGLPASQLGSEPVDGAAFTDLPQSLLDEKLWSKLEKEFVDWIYGNHRITVYKSPLTGELSNPGEAEGDFRARLVHAAHEVRDAKVEALRATYEKKIKGLEEKIAKAMDVVEDQKSQASSAKMDTAMRVGSSILGALLGKRVSMTSGRGAMSGASKAWKESRDVARAEEKVDEYQEELEKIEADCEEQIEKLKASMDPMSERLETLTVTPLKKNCSGQGRRDRVDALPRQRPADPRGGVVRRRGIRWSRIGKFPVFGDSFAKAGGLHPYQSRPPSPF
jgi:hypothetical protein